MMAKKIKVNKLNKVPKSINIQKSLTRILNDHKINGLTQSFNAFYSYFEPMIDYICDEFKKDKEFVNTSINLTEERTEKLRNLIDFKIFGNFSEAVRFIYLLGICELHRNGNGSSQIYNIENIYRILSKLEPIDYKKKQEEESLSKEMQEVLKKVVSIEEYREQEKAKNRKSL